jgi:pyruvate kinase
MVFQRRDERETRTKIVCTIGPASSDPQMLRTLVREGMDVARINASHGTNEEHAESVRRVRKAADEEGAVVAILVDLPGPKYRIGSLETPLDLAVGDWIAFSSEKADGSHHVIPLPHPELIAGAKAGRSWFLADGEIEVAVREVRPKAVIAEVLVGGTLLSRKGVYASGVTAHVAALTAADREIARAALSWDVDFFALSFVRSAEDVRELRDLLRHEPGAANVGIVAKIERQEALENLDGIFEAADAVMIARGDLGLAVPPQEVPARQKEIIRRCSERGIPVITATQMLESMIEKPWPTRAEASDVANAILDGTDAVMLSGETAIGRYPGRAVAMMREIAGYAEESAREARWRDLGVCGDGVTRIADAVSAATAHLAADVNARLIACVTASGYTARRVARERPHRTIVALTSDDRVLRQLALVWGVIPLRMPAVEGADDMFEAAAATLLEAGFAEKEDVIVVTAGLPVGGRGQTNVLKVHRLG